MKNIVYFDLETQKSAQDVGGWGNKDKMGLSVGVTYSTARAGYQVYGESQVEALIDELQRADLVVGFNHIRFDYRVLEGYSIFDFSQVPSLDMLIEVDKSLGRKVKLDDIAQATFGCQKSADGMQALKWFKKGMFAEIAEYCLFDVKITKLVYEYGAHHGHVLITNNFGDKRKIKVDW